MTPWIYLVVAGLFETGWVIGMKYSDGFTKTWPSVLTLTFMGISVYMLSIAIKTIPIGTGYAVWTGIGAAGAAILGIVLFAEPSSLPRLICIALVVAGMIGLKLTAG